MPEYTPPTAIDLTQPILWDDAAAPLDTPFPHVVNDWHDGERIWRPISAESYDHFANVLPPICYANNAFIVGAIEFHDTNGDPVRLYCHRTGYNLDHHYARLAYVREFQR